MINTLSIQNDQLTQPVSLTVSENTLNHFTVQGDLSATIKLTDHKISGSIQANRDKNNQRIFARTPYYRPKCTDYDSI